MEKDNPSWLYILNFIWGIIAIYIPPAFSKFFDVCVLCWAFFFSSMGGLLYETLLFYLLVPAAFMITTLPLFFLNLAFKKFRNRIKNRQLGIIIRVYILFSISSLIQGIVFLATPRY